MHQHSGSQVIKLLDLAELKDTSPYQLLCPLWTDVIEGENGAKSQSGPMHLTVHFKKN